MVGSQSYSENEMSGMGQLELESRALIKTAAALNMIKQHWGEKQNELEDALEKNRKLWTIIASAMSEEDCMQPVEVKKNILNLSMFIFKRTVAISLEPKPESLDVLININMNIAKGLAGNAAEK